MKLFIAFWLVAIASFSSPVWAAEKWRSYSISHLPNDGRTCAQTAEELAVKFSKITGNQTYKATCDRSGVEDFDITISYFSANISRVVSTESESAGIGFRGIYSSLAECQDFLPQELKIFSNETGLSPFVGFCFRDNSISATPFAARIDGIGDAKKYPYRFEASLFASSIDDHQTVQKAILDATLSSGVGVHQVGFNDDSGLRLIVRYYVATREHQFIDLREDIMGRFPSGTDVAPRAACSHQREAATQGFTGNFTSPGVWFCAYDQLLFEARLHLFRTQPREFIKTEWLSERYSTFRSCLADQPAKLAWYRSHSVIQPFAAICAWKAGIISSSNDAFAIKILTKTQEPENPLGMEPNL